MTYKDMETKLFICVSTGYGIQRLYDDEAVEDYEAKLPEDLTIGKELHDIATAALETNPSIMSFMLKTRDSDVNDYEKMLIEDTAHANNIDFDNWNPIFQCSTMLEALTMLPKIVKICRKLDWCNIWKDQEFNRIKTFPLNDGVANIGTVAFLTLEAENG